MLNTKTKIVGLSVITSVIIVCILLLKPNSSVTEVKDSSNSNEKETPSIANQWQWETELNSSQQLEPPNDVNSTLPFTAESVYNALQAVKMDSDGNIILNHDALISLDEALERIHNRLNENSLQILQNLIRKHLPQKAGAQTAEIVANYYQFLEAKEEFSKINEALTNTDNLEPLRALEVNEQLYAELQSLREVYLGYEVTESLFRVSDANAEYMFASMKLALDDSLTANERTQQQMEIESRHLEQSINIDNWPERFRIFKNEKAYIVASSISDVEKQEQLRKLLKQHFNEDELKRIEYLELDRLNTGAS